MYLSYATVSYFSSLSLSRRRLTCLCIVECFTDLDLSILFAEENAPPQEAHLDAQDGTMQVVLALQDDETPTEVVYDHTDKYRAMDILGWESAAENSEYWPWLQVSRFTFPFTLY